jgi:hypothetical protein
MSSEVRVGANVRVVSLPPYIKTAEPMPMLRPSNLLTIGQLGTITARQPGGYWAVKFDRGSFLLEADYLEVVV